MEEFEQQDEQPLANPANVQHSLSAYRRIAVGFLLLTIVVVLLVVYMVFARASVVVLSEQEGVNSEFIIDIAREAGPGEVRGDILEVEKSISRVFPTTDMIEVDAYAGGLVRITSTLSRAQTLVATTRLHTPSEILFRIQETVTVPAYGEVTVFAKADEKGEVGNVGNVTFVIPGLNPALRAQFTVESIEPITGGTTELAAVTQDNVDSAALVLEENLEAQLTELLSVQFDDMGLEEKGREFHFESSDKLTNVPIGKGATEFELSLKVRATAIAYSEADFTRVVSTRLKELLSYDQDLLGISEEGIEKKIEKLDVSGGRANVRVTARGISIISGEAPSLDPEKLTGITVEAATVYLENLDGVASASISASPFWAVRMPNIADHITVEVR